MGLSGLPSMFCKFPVGSLVKADVYWLQPHTNILSEPTEKA
jgi:hypothetical protein